MWFRVVIPSFDFLRLKQRTTYERIIRTQLPTTTTTELQHKTPHPHTHQKKTPWIISQPPTHPCFVCIKSWKLLPIFYRLDMCRRQYANDACNRGTAGNYRPSSRQQFPSSLFLLFSCLFNHTTNTYSILAFSTNNNLCNNLLDSSVKAPQTLKAKKNMQTCSTDAVLLLLCFFYSSSILLISCPTLTLRQCTSCSSNM